MERSLHSEEDGSLKQFSFSRMISYYLFIMKTGSIFKAYDIRGRYPEELNEKVVYKIGQALVKFLNADRLAVGYDLRPSSQKLAESLNKGIISQGCDAIDVGPAPSGLIPLVVAQQKLGGGVMISASHLGKEYNGLKLVNFSAQPIAADSGLEKIENLIQIEIPPAKEKGYVQQKDFLYDYLDYLFKFVDSEKIKPLKIVLDASGGPANKFASAIFDQLSCQTIKMNFHPHDKFFDHGLNPLLKENQKEVKEEILAQKADLGVIWDGDGDRCIFLDEQGKLVEPYFITAILSEIILKKNPKAKILHDLRLTWAIDETVKSNGGFSFAIKAGWSNFLPQMAKEKILFGGETSGHYFFSNLLIDDTKKENFVFGDGILPILFILEKLSQTGKKLSQLAEPYRQNYFVSGERNFKVSSPEKLLKILEGKYKDAKIISHLDGLTVEYNDPPAGGWRFNLRSSQTELMMRLNIEAKNRTLLAEKIREIEKIIKSYS